MLTCTKYSKYCIRLYSSSLFGDIAPAVQDALSRDIPVVALESTIITHGMPRPKNLETALAVQQIIREQGAVPATIGIIRGRIKVGLTDAELEYLAHTSSDAVKVSRRDLPSVVAKQANGGTTVAATMAIAHRANIPIFVTGGIGGVHRGGETSWDVSADLTELGRTPVAVVCSGVKSILDIPRTLQVLETQGVGVATYGAESDFPAFYCRRSGFKSPWHLRSIGEAVEYVRAMINVQLDSGIVIAVPVPERDSLNDVEIEKAIRAAVMEAESQGITGPRVTPFILKHIADVTHGALQANVALIKNNAEIGAKIAVGLKSFKPSIKGESIDGASVNSTGNKDQVTVVGGSVLDLVVQAHASGPEFLWQSCRDNRGKAFCNHLPEAPGCTVFTPLGAYQQRPVRPRHNRSGIIS